MHNTKKPQFRLILVRYWWADPSCTRNILVASGTWDELKIPFKVARKTAESEAKNPSFMWQWRFDHIRIEPV